MNRAVSSILILLLLVSQSVFAVPHSHAGSLIGEPEGHSDRLHFHLHDGHTHHGQHDDHDSLPSTSQQHSDHDSTAVYTGDEQLFRDGEIVRITGVDFCVAWLCEDISQAITVPGCFPWQHRQTVAPRPHCALYLQFLSIRC